MELTTELQKVSYSLGLLMASSVRSQGADTLDTDAVAAAFRDVFENNDLKISQQTLIPENIVLLPILHENLSIYENR